jgi:hypothetical protein
VWSGVQITRAVPQGGSSEGVKLTSVAVTYYFRAVPDSPFMVVVVIEGGSVTTLRPTSLVPESLPNRSEVFSREVALLTECSLGRGGLAVMRNHSAVHLPLRAFTSPASAVVNSESLHSMSEFLSAAIPNVRASLSVRRRWRL